MCIEYSLNKTQVNSPKGSKARTFRLPVAHLDSVPQEQQQQSAAAETPSVWACLWGSSDVENDSTPHLFSYVRNWVKFGVPTPSNDVEKEQLKWLGGFFAMCAAFYMVFPEAAYWCFNPWDLSVLPWLFFFQAKQWSLQSADLAVLGLLKFVKQPRLPFSETETGAEILKARHLKPLDYFFFRVNAVFDMVFLSHLTFYVLTDSAVTGIWDYSFFGLLQYIALSLAVWPIVLGVTDSYYAFLHWVMHKEPFYSGIHQIHHEIIIPDQGLVDVRSYSPIEIFLSSFVVLFALHTPGVTRLAGVLAFLTNVVANITNHSGYDVKLRMFGRDLFHTGNHEMHHRFPRTNMGIVTMLADIYLLDTYVPYKEEF